MIRAPSPIAAPSPITAGPSIRTPSPTADAGADQDAPVHLAIGREARARLAEWVLARRVGWSLRLDQLAAGLDADQPERDVEVPLEVLGRRADVVPVGAGLVNVEGDVMLEQRRENVEREVDHLLVREVVEDLRAERVDHAVREVGERLGGVGLLLEALDAAVDAGHDHPVLAACPSRA